MSKLSNSLKVQFVLSICVVLFLIVVLAVNFLFALPINKDDFLNNKHIYLKAVELVDEITEQYSVRSVSINVEEFILYQNESLVNHFKITEEYFKTLEALYDLEVYYIIKNPTTETNNYIRFSSYGNNKGIIFSPTETTVNEIKKQHILVKNSRVYSLGDGFFYFE